MTDTYNTNPAGDAVIEQRTKHAEKEKSLPPRDKLLPTFTIDFCEEEDVVLTEDIEIETPAHLITMLNLCTGYSVEDSLDSIFQSISHHIVDIDAYTVDDMYFIIKELHENSLSETRSALSVGDFLDQYAQLKAIVVDIPNDIAEIEYRN